MDTKWLPREGEVVSILPNDWSSLHGWAGRTGVAHHKAGTWYLVQLEDQTVLHCVLRELAPIDGATDGYATP